MKRMKGKRPKILFICLLVVIAFVYSCSGCSYSKSPADVITVDGDGIFTMSPSGSYPVFDYSGKYQRTYIGYYSSDHTIKLRYWEHVSGHLSDAVTLWQEWGYSSSGSVIGDDHANPTVIILKYQKGANALHNGKLLVAAAEHGSSDEGKGRLQVRRSGKPEDISAWEEMVQLRSTRATYARLVETFDGKIWLFCRLSRTAPNSQATFYYWISENAGGEWIGPELLIDVDERETDAIYMAVAANMASDELHFMFNRRVDNDPEKGCTRYQDIYYACYNVAQSTWHKIDGTVLTLPLTLSNVDTVYKTNSTMGKEDWTYLSGISVNKKDTPYLLSCTDQDRGASSVGGIGIVQRHSYDIIEQRWITGEVCYTASFHYMNLAALDPYNGDIVYACVPDEHGIVQLQKWQKKEGFWIKVLDITRGSSGHNARPYVVKIDGDMTRIFWSYITQYKGTPYTDWRSKILGFTDCSE